MIGNFIVGFVIATMLILLAMLIYGRGYEKGFLEGMRNKTK
jgi:hypothetical protein